MCQENIIILLASFGPLQSKEIALGAGVLKQTISRSLPGLKKSGEIVSMQGHGRAGGTLVFWDVAQ